VFPFTQEYFNYIQGRADFADVSGQTRVAFSYDFSQKFYDFLLVGVDLNYTLCPICLSPQDAGVVLNFAVYFGVVGTIVLLLFLVGGMKNCGGWSAVVLLPPLFSSKFFVWEPLWWMIILLLIQDCLNRNNAPTALSEQARLPERAR
jgi:hypothetical protein